MTNHNHKIELPSCEFAEQLIAVFYGEASEREKSEFAKHLIECGLCAAEQAAFGSVRNQIIEWRQNDFERLELKPIQVPVKSAAQSSGWTWRLKRWRDFLTPQKYFSTGAAAFAGLLICLGMLAFFSYLLANQNSKNEVAGNLAAPQNFPTLNNSAPPQLSATPTSNAAENNRTPGLPEPVNVKPASDATKANSFPPKRAAGTTNLHRSKSADKQSATPVVTLPANDLTIEEADDFEDDSLRLTDLLDDSTFPSSSK